MSVHENAQTADENTVDTAHETDAAEPVQGMLFADSAQIGEHRAYRGTVASKVAGITYRQLDYWARKHIVEPSLHSSNGSGSRRLYSFKDILVLAVSKRLLDAGVNLQNVTVAIGYLNQHSVDDMATITIMSDGESVYQCTTDEEVLDLVKGGKAVFGLSIGTLHHEIEEKLTHEQCIDLDEQTISEKTGRVIDELAAMRLRKKLEQREEERAAA
jgi:DNA-binding transcriptional MerR regulator